MNGVEIMAAIEYTFEKCLKCGTVISEEEASDMVVDIVRSIVSDPNSIEVFVSPRDMYEALCSIGIEKNKEEFYQIVASTPAAEAYPVEGRITISDELMRVLTREGLIDIDVIDVKKSIHGKIHYYIWKMTELMEMYMKHFEIKEMTKEYVEAFFIHIRTHEQTHMLQTDEDMEGVEVTVLAYKQAMAGDGVAYWNLKHEAAANLASFNALQTYMEDRPYLNK